MKRNVHTRTSIFQLHLLFFLARSELLIWCEGSPSVCNNNLLLISPQIFPSGFAVCFLMEQSLNRCKSVKNPLLKARHISATERGQKGKYRVRIAVKQKENKSFNVKYVTCYTQTYFIVINKCNLTILNTTNSCYVLFKSGYSDCFIVFLRFYFCVNLEPDYT